LDIKREEPYQNTVESKIRNTTLYCASAVLLTKKKHFVSDPDPTFYLTTDLLGPDNDTGFATPLKVKFLHLFSLFSQIVFLILLTVGNIEDS
jgi:hypothetical protein